MRLCNHDIYISNRGILRQSEATEYSITSRFGRMAALILILPYRKASIRGNVRVNIGLRAYLADYYNNRKPRQT